WELTMGREVCQLSVQSPLQGVICQTRLSSRL
ncbi:hypothetical protein HKBW3S34_01411, partial [Candidatus Hakubella thermalkaliphila]